LIGKTVLADDLTDPVELMGHALAGCDDVIESIGNFTR